MTQNAADAAVKPRQDDAETAPRPDLRTALANVAAFAGLRAETLDRLAAAATRETYEPGETVFTMGQSDGALSLVTHGEARLTKAAGERGDISVETVEAGGWIGLIPFALQDGTLTSAALQAVRALELITIDPVAVRALAEEDAPLALALMRLCAETARNRKAVMDPEARVYRHLLSLVRKSSGGAEIKQMPRHAVLAAAAGVSDVEAASAVASLISRGIAKRAYPGLVVLDPAALHRAAFD